jgi:hypothetical protein
VRSLLLQLLRRVLRLHGDAVDNAGDSMRADDVAREHRETVASDVREVVAARDANV